jgi:ribonucleotide monophosphatase NagD (HAD superfamily)
VPKSAVLAIGDGAATDIRGAFDQEIDALFVTGGIHAGDFGSRDAPDIAAVRRFLAEAGLGARAVAARLEWP